jgi:DeoR/GlpR family transcriptional regulator of sugar metabolism
VKHDPTIVEAISRATGMSPRTVKRGLNELIKAGYLATDPNGYLAIMKKPPADQAKGSAISETSLLAPIGDPARQGGQDAD